jgi:1,4-dihydroxy-2-naphthoate octaprenyltransferase
MPGPRAHRLIRVRIAQALAWRNDSMQDGSPRPASKETPTTRAARPGAKVAARIPEPRGTPAPNMPDMPETLDELDDLDAPGVGRADAPATDSAPTTDQPLRAWRRLAGAPYLILSVAPVLVAAAWMWSRGARLAFGPLILTAAGAALVQAGAHLLDASVEAERGKRTAQGIAPGIVLRAAIVLLVLGAMLGVPLVAAGGTSVLLLGGAALLAAVGYSTTPYALKRLPLGDLVVALACGPGVVALTVLAQRQPVTPFALALGVGLGLCAAALVEAANLRALVAGVGKDGHMLARLLGLRGGRLLYLATLAAAYLVVLVAAAWQGAPHGALAVLFSLPVAILPLTGVLRARAAATLTPVVTSTLRAYVYFAFWLIIGLLLGALYLHLLRLTGS